MGMLALIKPYSLLHNKNLLLKTFVNKAIQKKPVAQYFVTLTRFLIDFNIYLKVNTVF